MISFLTRGGATVSSHSSVRPAACSVLTDVRPLLARLSAEQADVQELRWGRGRLVLLDREVPCVDVVLMSRPPGWRSPDHGEVLVLRAALATHFMSLQPDLLDGEGD